jgi:hypothetical protein
VAKVLLSPPAGSYLAGHWNTATSSFLQDDEAPRPAQPTLGGAATITYGGRAALHGRLTDEQAAPGIGGEQVNMFADPAGPGGERGAGSDTTDPTATPAPPRHRWPPPATGPTFQGRTPSGPPTAPR